MNVKVEFDGDKREERARGGCIIKIGTPPYCESVIQSVGSLVAVNQGMGSRCFNSYG